jgi:hypothetical protein
MTTKVKTRDGQLSADQKLIDGTEKFLAKYPELPVGSQNMATTDIVKVFQGRIGTSKAVLTADAARTAAIKADRDERQKTSAFVQAFRRMVLGMFLQSPDTLATFGLKAPKAVKKDVETKSTAVAKSKATRKARNTMGTKQKKTVKGTVPAAKSGPDPKVAAVTNSPTPPTPPATSGTAPAPSAAAKPTA